MPNNEIIISLEVLDELKIKMQEMEPQRKKIFSKREAVLYLVDGIQDLLIKNYSVSEISEMLKNEGIDISAQTLKIYLREVEKTKAKVKKQRAPRAATREATQRHGEQKENEVTAPKQTVKMETQRKAARDVGFEIEEDDEI